MNKFLCTTVLAMLCYMYAFSQDNNLGRVSTKSPEASAIEMYNAYPIDYASGVPNIDIALFEINTRAGKIPFKINYHVGSFKPSNLSGIIGFGWSLSPNIGITRTVNGGTDNINSGFTKNTQLNTGASPDNNYSLSASENIIDEQPDDFSFSLLGRSGQFIYKNNSAGFTTIPYVPIKIQRPTNDSFIITDDDGTIYRFGASLSGGTAKVEWSENGQESSISSWKITEIIPFDKSDTIRFTYGTVFSHVIPYYNIHTKITRTLQDPSTPRRLTQIWNVKTDFYLNNGSGNHADIAYAATYPYCTPVNSSPGSDGSGWIFNASIAPFWSSSKSTYRSNNTYAPEYSTLGYQGDVLDGSLTTYQETNEMLLSTISFKDGSVQYLYTSDNKLQSLTLFDKKGIQRKRIYFHQNNTGLLNNEPQPQPYYDTQNVRHLLDSLSIVTTQGEALKYRFNYISQGNTKSIFGVYGNYNTDFWGFFNGKRDVIVPALSIVADEFYRPNNCTFDPMITNPPPALVNAGNVNLLVGYNQEEAVIKSMPQGLLSRVVYPTGGSASFTFENNRYESSGTPGKVVVGAGYRIQEIRYRTAYGQDSLTRIYKYGIGENGLGKTRYKLHAANFISRYVVRDPSTGKIEMITKVNAKPTLGLSFSSGTPIIYQEVAEYQFSPASNNDNGKTVYRYQVNTKADNWLLNTSLHADPRDSWKEYYITEREQYKKNSNVYEPVHKTIYYNHEFATDTVYAGGTYRAYYSGDNNNLTAGNSYVNTFDHFEYMIKTGITLVDSVQEYNYIGTPAIQKTASYLYYPQTYYKKWETLTTSGADKRRTLFQYVNNKNDVAGLSTEQSSLMDQMIVDNRLRNILKVNNYTDGQLQKQMRREYASYNAKILPSAIFEAGLSGTFRERTRISGYDFRGNVLDVVDNGNQKQSYLWGYNKEYPIAAVVNAVQKDILFEGFEEWTGGNLSANNDAHTGHYSKNGGYTKALTGLTNGTYILSYWRKVSGVWTHVFANNINVTNGTYTIGLASTYPLDDIRFYPENAQMSSFTYDPLVGMTSSMDAKGMVTYYEYDNFNRLKYVKDQNGSILKANDYHYKAQ